jgi:anti-sigma factor RsiW
MNHASDRQLLAHLQEALSADDEQALAAHLRDCGACRQRLAELGGVWRLLGSWKAPGVPGDLRERILTALPAQPATPKASGWRRPLRVAAALALAAGIGHVAGRFTWEPAAPPPNEEAAAASLHLDEPTTARLLLAALDAPEGGQR